MEEKLSLEEAWQILAQIITYNLTHTDYDHVVGKKELYYKLVTGDVDSLYHQYAPREDNLIFAYKKEMTKAITPAVISSVIKPFNKVARSNALVKKVISINQSESDDNGPAEKVIQAMQTFYGSENNVNGLDFFVQSRYKELSFTDPNAWIVTEFAEVDDTYKPYPLEIGADKAVNFCLINNVLVHLVAREDIQYMEPLPLISPAEKTKLRAAGQEVLTHEQKNGYKYSMFTADYTIVIEQVGSDHAIPGVDDDYYDENAEIVNLPTGTYVRTVFPHMIGKTPAKRIGYMRDLATDGRTFVSPYDDALCYLEGSIKTASEFEITKADHVFPQKLQYVPPCPGESDTNTCFNGRAAMGGICSVCHGKGTMPIHQGANDVITIKMPEDSSQLVDLNKLLAYFSPPIELVKFQNELVKQVKIDVHQTVFNSTVLLKDTTGQAVTTETATSKNFDMDSINDTLSPYGEGLESFWLFEAEICARILEVLDKVEFIYRLPSDFKMRTIGDLYDEMKTANDSNAPTFLIEMLNDNLAQTKFQDDPDRLLEYEVKKRLNPFRGKTDEDIIAAINTDYTPLWKKVLSINFEDIISQAELKVKDFYVQDNDLQLKTVKEITQEMIDEINAGKETPTLKPIGNNNPDNALYAVGDSVTVATGSETDESHAGVSFTVKSVKPSGDTFVYSLVNADETITASYTEDLLN